MKLINPKKLLLKEVLMIKKSLSFLENSYIQNFDKLCKLSLQAIKKGNKIIFFGNGGSAADSQHLAAELVVKYKKKRKAISAIALTTDTSILTSISNDFNYKYIFSRQIEAIGKKGDIAIAITTSGNSQNLIEAVKIAKRMKIHCFCINGSKKGKISKFVKDQIVIPSTVTSQIQVLQILIGQVMCEYLESKIR